MSAPSGLAIVRALNVEGSEGCIREFYDRLVAEA